MHLNDAMTQLSYDVRVFGLICAEWSTTRAAEIPGQILVPEPGSLALFGIAALGLLAPTLRRAA